MLQSSTYSEKCSVLYTHHYSIVPSSLAGLKSPMLLHLIVLPVKYLASYSVLTTLSLALHRVHVSAVTSLEAACSRPLGG